MKWILRRPQKGNRPWCVLSGGNSPHYPPTSSCGKILSIVTLVLVPCSLLSHYYCPGPAPHCPAVIPPYSNLPMMLPESVEQGTPLLTHLSWLPIVCTPSRSGIKSFHCLAQLIMLHLDSWLPTPESDRGQLKSERTY